MEWGKGVEGEYQRAINRTGRSTPGVFCSTSLSIVAAESGHTPARALINDRQARPAYCIHARPKDGEGPEGVLEREGGQPSRHGSGLRRHSAPGRQGPRVGQPPALSGPDCSRQQARRAPDCRTLDQRGHHLDRWLLAGQWEGRGGMCLEDPQWVDRAALRSRLQQGGFRR